MASSEPPSSTPSSQQQQRQWGDYYFGEKLGSDRKSRLLETIYSTSQVLPTFNELFDEETFYVFAFCLVLGSFFIAFLLARVFKIRVREHSLQQCTIHYFLAKHADCVVQAPTGSGKTLAYLLPTMQMMREWMAKQAAPSATDVEKCQVCALVIVPSRELVEQVGSLFKPLCAVDGLGFRLLQLVGGVKKKKVERMFTRGGPSVLVATPGRLQVAIETDPKVKLSLKTLEMLVVDEADRFSDSAEFKSAMTVILAALPKQRRTGLFSATQAKQVEELMRYGLRNPVRLLVRSDGGTEKPVLGLGSSSKNGANEDGGGAAAPTVVTPKELANYHWEVPASEKLLALVRFLNKVAASGKVLLFFCSAASVDYFAAVLPQLLKAKKEEGKPTLERKVLALHRKKRDRRTKILDQFRRSADCILLATDLMARGIDVVDIDWVLQYDIPKHSSLFIHRSGRSARSGRIGSSLLFLTPEESAYVEFVQKHERVELKPWKPPFKFGGGGTDKAAEKLRARVQELAIADRKILEGGSRAFVSYVQAYLKHDCQIVCKLRDVDLVGVANSFALLQLPKMRELSQLGPDKLASFEPRRDVSTGRIAYADPQLEARRQAKRSGVLPTSEASSNHATRKGGNKESHLLKEESEEEEEEEMEAGDSKRKAGKRRRMNAWEELEEDSRLLKKFKKGKLSKVQLDQKLAGF